MRTILVVIEKRFFMKTNKETVLYTGWVLTALRLVVGWTYFSAFWRRLILENKLVQDQAGYIGEKFNHFLPHALGIKGLIEYLVSHPDALWWAMVVFTIVEGIVGLFFMLGLFTRLMSFGVLALAMGILLGSGWIGTTCLDEWQIGVLGVTAGFTIFIGGAGKWSLDHWLIQKRAGIAQTKTFAWLAAGELPLKEKAFTRLMAVATVFLIGLTLYTNQVFHGGVFGKLHNKSVRPVVEITEVNWKERQISFDLMRVEGADVYGSFLIVIQLLDANGELLQEWGQSELSTFTNKEILNKYVAKIKAGKHALILPLGAKATLSLPLKEGVGKPAQIKLIDISGIEWVEPIP